jgi:uncharacterized membrane protein
MAPLVVLIAGTLVSWLLGRLGVELFASWPAAVRGGLALMFLFTAAAHFNSMRHDLARMLPPALPRPMAWIYFTGVCEILGAFGLLYFLTRTLAAAALILFLLTVLPANIHAARVGVTLRGKAVTPLWLRIPMQLLFIALTAWAGLLNPAR